MKKYNLFFNLGPQQQPFTIEIEPDELINPKSKFIKAIKTIGQKEEVYINADKIVYFSEDKKKERDFAEQA